MAAQSALGRLAASCNCKVTRFCCCSLRAGVIITSFFLFVNACMAFAGEAALFMGLLTAVGEQATGQYLPPGTKIDDVRIQGAFIGIGLYALIGSILGFIAAFRKNVRAATGFWVMCLINVTLGIAIAVISWFVGSSFSALLGQAPGFALNIYVMICAKAYRDELKSGGRHEELGLPPHRSTGSAGMHDLDAGVNERDVDLEGGLSNARGGAGKGGQRAANNIEIGTEEDEDADIGHGGNGHQ